MPLSSIPRVSQPRQQEVSEGRSPFLIIVLSVLLAIYIGCISFWLISGDTISEQATAAPAQVQTSATQAN